MQSSVEYASNRKLNNVMNVKVQEHQRSILAAMGIDLWIPKKDVSVRHVQNQLYRDVAAQEITSNLQFNVDRATSETPKAPLNPVLDLQQFATQAQSARVDSIQDASLITGQTVTVVETAQKNIVNEIVEAQTIAAFELQAFCLKSCVMIIDATQINAAQQKLWLNIQNVLLGEYFELKWPFPILQFQDGRGVSMYIQGFLDALRQDKVVLSLGEIPHLHNADIIQLASLQEMLQQPKLKRRLWQFMQQSQ